MTTCGRIYGLIPDEECCVRPGIALEIVGLVMEKLKLPYQLVRYNETVIERTYIFASDEPLLCRLRSVFWNTRSKLQTRRL